MKGGRQLIWSMALEQGHIRSADVTRKYPQIPLNEAARELSDMTLRGNFTRELVKGVRGHVYTPIPDHPPLGKRAKRKRVKALICTFDEHGRSRVVKRPRPTNKAVRIEQAKRLSANLFECAPIVRVGA